MRCANTNVFASLGQQIKNRQSPRPTG